MLTYARTLAAHSMLVADTAHRRSNKAIDSTSNDTVLRCSLVYTKGRGQGQKFVKSSHKWREISLKIEKEKGRKQKNVTRCEPVDCDVIKFDTSDKLVRVNVYKERCIQRQLIIATVLRAMKNT